MPYKKSYNKKKSNYKKYSGYVKDASTVGYKALQIALMTKRLLNVEFKFFDIIGANLAVPDGVGTIVQLTNIPQGDTDVTRDGAQVKLMSINFKAVIRVNTSVANTGSSVTVMLIEDRQTNGAIYITADLLASVENSVSVVSSLNLDNKFRFRVLKRWIFMISKEGANRRILKWHHKFGDKMKIRYENSTPSIADLNSRSLSLLFISNESTNEPAITFFNRLRYIDN